MGLPKNYQEKVNLPNRVKALNDLTFYVFKYKFNSTQSKVEATPTEIIDIAKKSFREELEDKKIMDILNYKERD